MADDMYLPLLEQCIERFFLFVDENLAAQVACEKRNGEQAVEVHEYNPQRYGAQPALCHFILQFIRDLGHVLFYSQLFDGGDQVRYVPIDFFQHEQWQVGIFFEHSVVGVYNFPYSL